jgi:formylglycine-generating enzyme required for sulfatase activity
LENRYNCFIYDDHALFLSIKNALTIHIHFLKIEVMKAVYSTCLLALIFAASAEVRAFPAVLPPAVAETRLAAQQERSQLRESERPPSAAAIQNKTNNACPNCPELISIPGNKFAIGKFAVTFDEWDACVTDGGCGGYQPLDNGWGRGKRPVINVSWDNAQAYIQWLSRKTGKNYRLPSEEEWEIAARAGTATDYYWGNDVGRNNANCDGCGSEWDNRKTAPVGSFKPNAFGLYDMMGNVWQWTDTCWQGNCAKRVFCGGSWNHRPEDMRATTRNWFDTTKRMRYLGFRLAMTLP